MPRIRFRMRALCQAHCLSARVLYAMLCCAPCTTGCTTVCDRACSADSGIQSSGVLTRPSRTIEKCATRTESSWGPAALRACCHCASMPFKSAYLAVSASLLLLCSGVCRDLADRQVVATTGCEERGESAAIPDGHTAASCARFAGAEHSWRAWSSHAAAATEPC